MIDHIMGDEDDDEEENDNLLNLPRITEKSAAKKIRKFLVTL